MRRGTRVALVQLCMLLVFSFSLVGIYSQTSYAAQITSRSLTLQASGTDPGSTPGGVVNHLFNFTLPSSSSVGSIKLEYCTSASGTCVGPTGLTTTGSTLGSESGATGFSYVAASPGVNASYLTRTASGATGAVSYRIDDVTNPTGVNETFFVRISTYASIDTTGSPTDTGTVAASTAEPIVLTGTMPESLIFCTGATISTTTSIPDCSTATSGIISFDQLFSPTSTATSTSQIAASTNASSGYAITVNGPTLTSGGNTVPAMTTAAVSAKGIGQFGLNLRANTTATSAVATGIDVVPAANGTTFKGQAIAGYDTVDTFKFVSGNTVADSANGGAGPTDAQIYTATYIVNVPGSQKAGIYTSTLTYICTPTF